MENIHGVDVSWLHRSTADPSIKHDASPQPQTPPPFPHSDSDPHPSAEPKEHNHKTPTPEASQPINIQAPKPSPRRPGLLGRRSHEKPHASTTPPEEAKSTKRSSWRSLSSKFISSPQTDPTPSSTRSVKTGHNAPLRAPSVDAPKDSFEESIDDGEESYAASPPPKSGSFFSSALRRLSSTGPAQAPAATPAAEQVPVCQRQILNVDRGRDRPSVKGLSQAKLRRVSFSVDVEIAGNSRYPVEDVALEDDLAAKKTKKKEKMKKERAEGESLKHPGLRKGETEREGLLHAMGRDGMFDIGVAEALQEDDVDVPVSPPEAPDSQRRKEKEVPKPVEPPKQPESLPPEPKPDIPVAQPEPQPKVPSDATGAANADAHTPNGNATPTEAKPHHKTHDRPTTDPLRIYRRCCQLREAPVLKRISEQLGNPNNCGVDTPGVVTCLNLTKSRMQMADIVCLGDWLAIVPVRKLLLEDANLTDEGVRIILAGLLAAKVPDMHKRKRGRSSPTRLRDNTIIRSSGVIEKIILKNNKKLTAEAWRHISLFIHMSKSIKAVDVSMIKLPKAFPQASSANEAEIDPVTLLSQSITNRHGGDHLEELIFGECGLDTRQVEKITDAVTSIKLKRLCLAGNRLDQQGLECVARYLSANVCKGIDLGGNDLRERLPIITDALTEDNPIWAICLANCNLNVAALRPLFPALVGLPDFRFLDLSHNRELFLERPTALGALRTYLPQMPLLKRLHLMGVSLSPADVIGLVEIIPEVRNLAHLNVLENPKLEAIVSSSDTASQEEACAMFASIMTAVRLSKTFFCVDMDVPGEGSSEVVKALARQTFAYCLRNMERFSDSSVIRVSDAAAALPDISDADVDLLNHIAGPSDDENKTDELHEPDRHDDFIVGGRGWVKALSHCLDAADFRRVSVGGDITPSQVMDSAAGKEKAKEVSKTLLVNARNFRTRLESAIVREETGTPEEDVMRRLQFLHHALNTMIDRFEQEYPDTRLVHHEHISSTGDPKDFREAANQAEDEAIDTSSSPTASRTSSPSRTLEPSEPSSEHPASALDDFFADDETDYPRKLSVSARRGSEVELHNRELTLEEGAMHKIGQRFRRTVLPPSGTTDHLHGTSERDAPEPEHLAKLRSQLEQFGGDEIKERYAKGGLEGILKELDFETPPRSP